MIGQGMAAGGPPAAMESFLRWAAGDAAFEAVDPTDRDRWLGNGAVFFGVELAPTMAYAPSLQAIADAQVPIVAAASHDSRDPASRHHFLYQAAAWLAHQVGVDLVEVPGGHMAYLTDRRRWPRVCARCCETAAEPRHPARHHRPSEGHGPDHANQQGESQPGRRSETRS
jgi:hypothetical protein